MQGWIKLFRKILDSWIWNTGEPYDRRSAWIELLLMANHAENKFMFNGHLFIVPAGSFITSETKLAARWKWSRKKVDGYLTALENGDSITLIKNRKSTMISIENWEKYQGARTTEEPQKSIKKAAEEYLGNINKNGENRNNLSPLNPPMGNKRQSNGLRSRARYDNQRQYTADEMQRIGPNLLDNT